MRAETELDGGGTEEVEETRGGAVNAGASSGEREGICLPREVQCNSTAYSMGCRAVSRGQGSLLHGVGKMAVEHAQLHQVTWT